MGSSSRNIIRFFFSFCFCTAMKHSLKYSLRWLPALCACSSERRRLLPCHWLAASQALACNGWHRLRVLDKKRRCGRAERMGWRETARRAWNGFIWTINACALRVDAHKRILAFGHAHHVFRTAFASRFSVVSFKRMSLDGFGIISLSTKVDLWAFSHFS